MGQFYDEIPSDDLIEWIKEQKMFWVASAPLDRQGSVNVSPKGYDSFEVVSKNAVWYQDMTGSGNETISHMREPGNARLTIMFHAFEGPPRICRLFGHGKVFERDSPEYNKLLPIGDPRRLPGSRAIIWLDVDRVGTSCGYSIPFYEYVKDRNRLKDHFVKFEDVDSKYLETHDCGDCTLAPASTKGGMRAYWELKNSESVDGLPGIALAGFPPKEGAIRKNRKGVTVAYGNAANQPNWLQSGATLFGADRRFELGLVVGIAAGIWIGTRGWEGFIPR